MYWPQYATDQGDWANLYTLRRARDAYPTATLFGDLNAPQPNDISQGYLGDCYFLASCSAYAEWNQKIKNMFVTQTYNKEGVIIAKGQVLGIEKEIAIDDILPFYSNN